MAYPVDNLRCTEEVCVVCMMCTWGKKSKSLFPSYLFMAIVPVIDSLEREGEDSLQYFKIM